MFRGLFFKNDKDEKVPYTLDSHGKNLSKLIKEMEECEVEASDENDKKNAENQLNFARHMLRYINDMLKLSGLNFSAKKELGEKMTVLPKTYFNDDEIPLIEGEKSKIFALKIADHYRSFTRVEFGTIEIEASKAASKIEFLHIRSIPEQIEHHRKLAERIESDVQVYHRGNINIRLS